MRAIAAEAGVDPALVHHYFGTKDDLFMAALQLPGRPARAARAGDRGRAPTTRRSGCCAIFLGVWDDPDEPARRSSACSAACSTRRGSGCSAQGFVPVVLGPVGQALGIDHPERRMPLVASQMIGLIMCRYVLAARAARLDGAGDCWWRRTPRRSSATSTGELPLDS